MSKANGGLNLGGLRKALGQRFRRERMELFQRLFRPDANARILDVGGDPWIWSLLPQRPGVVLSNVSRSDDALRDKESTWVLADGKRLPFRDGAFDIVFCNSVIEHVGKLDQQRRLAQEIRRVGHRYFVETPNREFFFEPHLLTPFVHWLPRRAMGKLLRRGTVWGLARKPSEEQCEAFMRDVYLLDPFQMRRLFPDARFLREKFLGMTKSIIMVKTQPDAGPEKERVGAKVGASNGNAERGES